MGNLFRPLIGRSSVAIETFVICLVLAGCGADDPGPAPVASTPSATASPEPTPSLTPTETPIPTATATPTPVATPTPTATADSGGIEAPADEGGDEEGLGVPIDVRVTAEQISVTPSIVPAFLPLDVTVTSALDEDIDLVVIQAAGDGIPVGRGRIPAGGTTTIKVDGLQPGSGEILSPDLNPDRTAFFEVRRD